MALHEALIQFKVYSHKLYYLVRKIHSKAKSPSVTCREFFKGEHWHQKGFSFCWISFHSFRKPEWQESHFKRFLYKAIFCTEYGAHKCVRSYGNGWKCLENRRLSILAQDFEALKLLSATHQFTFIKQQASHGEIYTRIIDSIHLLL